MNSQNILYSKEKNDECHTLPYAVKPILKYIPDEWVIWCPFDNEKSEFVRQFRNKGNKVIHHGNQFLITICNKESKSSKQSSIILDIGFLDSDL